MKYDSEKHYPILLESQRKEMSIHGCMLALAAQGIKWEGLTKEIDKDLLRAWKELGHRNN